MTDATTKLANLTTFIAALESGDYPQRKHRLVGFNDTGPLAFCCLGVLCLLNGMTTQQFDPDSAFRSIYDPQTGLTYETMPPDELAEPYDLHRDLPKPYQPSCSIDGLNALAVLNDDYTTWQDQVLPALRAVVNRLQNEQELS